MNKITIVTITMLFLLCTLCTEKPTEVNSEEPSDFSPPIESWHPVPSNAQLNWQNAELIMFIHFGINTFTDKEWGDGTENPFLFNPSSIAVEQWVDVAKENGFQYIILTAKHHDGFCLWPSKYTSHSIKNSPYKNGEGDILKEFSEACHRKGVKFCFYLSPWDRHEKTFGTDQYNIYYQNQLIELLTNYGDVGEVWLDGANDGSIDVTRWDYDWNLIFTTIKHYQPNSLIGGIGTDIRWIGNENGLGNETEWCTQPKIFSIQTASFDNITWYPSECDVSIRPGWFYHQSENSKIKPVNQLTDIYFKSVGRNSNLLLNVPPDRRGLISEHDIARLREWKEHLNQIFAQDLFFEQSIECTNVRRNSEYYSAKKCIDNNPNTFWTTDKEVKTAELIITLSQKKDINIIRLEEAIDYGQRISSFSIFSDNGGKMEKIFDGTTIGHSRLITFSKVTTDKIKIIINDSYASPTLRTIKAFYSESI